MASFKPKKEEGSYLMNYPMYVYINLFFIKISIKTKLINNLKNIKKII